MENVINAIGQLWKLVGVVVLGIIIFIFREQIKSILTERNLKFKKGDTELEVNSSILTREEQNIAIEQVTATLDKASIDDATKEKKSDSQFEMLLESYTNRDRAEMDKVIRDIEEDSELDFKEKIKYKSIYYRLCFKLGDSEALDKLDELSCKYKENEEIYTVILRQLAIEYMEINQHEKALKIFEKAIQNCTSIKEKAELISKMALCLLDLKLDVKAITILIDAINEEENNKDSLCIYYTNLANIYEQTNEIELKVLALEKALQYCSNDTNIIFDIAHSYDKVGHKDLTLLHYNNLLKFDPNNNGALNNKGVVCNDLELHGKKIESYKGAISSGNSLASANIAYEYMENGFYQEAQAVLKQASSIENPHINVSKAVTYLNEIIQSEIEKEKNIISNAIVKQRFFNRYAEAYFNTSSSLNLSNTNWRLGESILEVNQVDNNVEGIWNENGVDYKFEGIAFGMSLKAKLSKSSYDFNFKTYQFNEFGTAYVYASNNDGLLYMLMIENGKYILKKFENITKEE